MSKRQLVFNLLYEAGRHGVTTSELLAAGAGSRYGGRIFELRRMGHEIDTERLRAGAYRYTLRCPGPLVLAPDYVDTSESLFDIEPLSPPLDWDAA
jgi:hypothetical protein